MVKITDWGLAEVEEAVVGLANGAGLRIALFITCYNDTLFPETGKAVVRVLERLGHESTFPDGQTCCGQCM